MTESYPRLIAFYLPQYHPIPENDEWWGKGFTEWTNVAKARPLFKGHYQPHLPADLGYYDLRVPEVRQAQADMAREAGIEGFCYWHYWFAGKQLLERPFNEVLASGKPDFPFCLSWANQSWTGIWHGAPERVLIEQTYPGEKDHIAHIKTLLPAFKDKRYIRVENKPLFVIYKPKDLPYVKKTIDLWQNFAIENGLPGLFIVGVINDQSDGNSLLDQGFDGFTLSRLPITPRIASNPVLRILSRFIGQKRVHKAYQKLFKKPLNIYNFPDINHQMVIKSDQAYECYPCLYPNWDNTPRAGLDGYILLNSSPGLFRKQLWDGLNHVTNLKSDHQLVFIKSWNEWAEGNYLEPDQKYGSEYLDVIKEFRAEWIHNHTS